MADPLAVGAAVRSIVEADGAPFVRVPPDIGFAVRMLDDVVASELDLVMVATARSTPDPRMRSVPKRSCAHSRRPAPGS